MMFPTDAGLFNEGKQCSQSRLVSAFKFLHFLILFLVMQRKTPLLPKLPLFDSICQYFTALFVLFLHFLLLTPELLHPAELQAAHNATCSIPLRVAKDQMASSFTVAKDGKRFYKGQIWQETLQWQKMARSFTTAKDSSELYHGRRATMNSTVTKMRRGFTVSKDGNKLYNAGRQQSVLQWQKMATGFTVVKNGYELHIDRWQ